MVDCITEIPLPGRTFAAPAAAGASALGDLTMPSFVAGPENRLVAEALSRLLEANHRQPDSEPNLPNVVVLYGTSGTGKTHLLRGLVKFWQQQRGPQSAEYFTAADYRRSLGDAIAAENTNDFRSYLLDCELVALDDLDRVPKKDYLQHDLRNLIDQYSELGRTLLVATTRPVQTLANLSPDVRSRLASGLVLQLSPPGDGARQCIARHAASALGHSPSEAEIERLSTVAAGTTREVFAEMFRQLADRQALTNADSKTPVTPPAIHRPPLREIISVVAKYFSVPQKVLKSSSRQQSTVAARAAVIYLARELCDLSYQKIGDILGGRDHTTIMHSYRKIQRRAQSDLATSQALDDLRRILLSH